MIGAMPGVEMPISETTRVLCASGCYVTGSWVEEFHARVVVPTNGRIRDNLEAG